ncbi:ribbon-helix-helix protein, CopG family [Tsuneonella sp. CC-YZS046]
MRQTHQTNLISFRASDQLANAILERAARSGVSISECLRSVVREKVGLQ